MVVKEGIRVCGRCDCMDMIVNESKFVGETEVGVLMTLFRGFFLNVGEKTPK